MRLPFLALLLVPAALAAQAPAAGGGQPPALRIPGLSPAGVAALDKLKGRQNPALPAQLQAEAAANQQMQAVLGAATIDPDKFAAALARNRAVSANRRKIVDDQVMIAIRALPPGDRKAFLRAISNPQVVQPAGPPRQ